MSLLAHVLETCSDPDCEVHQIEVGLSEDTVTNADLAFFIAGAQAMYDNVQRELQARGLEIPVAVMIEAMRPIMTLGSRAGRSVVKPRFDGPVCPNCARPLLVVDGRCLCCGHKV